MWNSLRDGITDKTNLKILRSPINCKRIIKAKKKKEKEEETIRLAEEKRKAEEAKEFRLREGEGEREEEGVDEEEEGEGDVGDYNEKGYYEKGYDGIPPSMSFSTSELACLVNGLEGEVSGNSYEKVYSEEGKITTGVKEEDEVDFNLPYSVVKNSNYDSNNEGNCNSHECFNSKQPIDDLIENWFRGNMDDNWQNEFAILSNNKR